MISLIYLDSSEAFCLGPTGRETAGKMLPGLEQHRRGRKAAESSNGVTRRSFPPLLGAAAKQGWCPASRRGGGRQVSGVLGVPGSVPLAHVPRRNRRLRAG